MTVSFAGEVESNLNSVERIVHYIRAIPQEQETVSHNKKKALGSSITQIEEMEIDEDKTEKKKKQESSLKNWPKSGEIVFNDVSFKFVLSIFSNFFPKILKQKQKQVQVRASSCFEKCFS